MLAATLHHPLILKSSIRRMQGSRSHSYLPLRCCVLLGHSVAY